ncbi:hypothetical protein KL938_000517 [Ogataea parapolymorpha]|nr:hypothetical protein KL938_000517 [Ogataea parapolymorpha]
MAGKAVIITPSVLGNIVRGAVFCKVGVFLCQNMMPQFVHRAKVHDVPLRWFKNITLGPGLKEPIPLGSLRS